MQAPWALISGLLGKYVDYQSLSPKYCKINMTPLAGIKAYKKKIPLEGEKC